MRNDTHSGSAIIKTKEIDLLRHQINEISNANLSVTEEDEIATRYRLANR